MPNENLWILELSESCYRRTYGMRSVHKHEFTHEGSHYTSKMPKREAKNLARILSDNRIYYRIYPAEYARSSNYRYTFMKTHPPDKHGYYRCAYCGRKIKASNMEVDHIIPVSKAKKYRKYQKKLKNGVNDPSNMVPACRKCNRRKRDSTNVIWRIRLSVMKHGWSRRLWKFIKLLFWLALAAGCLYVYRHPECIRGFIEFIENRIAAGMH